MLCVGSFWFYIVCYVWLSCLERIVLKRWSWICCLLRWLRLCVWRRQPNLWQRRWLIVRLERWSYAVPACRWRSGRKCYWFGPHMRRECLNPSSSRPCILLVGKKKLRELSGIWWLGIRDMKTCANVGVLKSNYVLLRVVLLMLMGSFWCFILKLRLDALSLIWMGGTPNITPSAAVDVDL